MLTLAPIVTSFQQSLEKIDETSNLSIAQLEELGIPADIHEQIREIGAKRIILLKEKLEHDLHWLKEIAEDQRYIPELAVPQEKFAKFLIDDFEEGLADIQEYRWFHRSLPPDAERLMKKYDTYLKAQMSKRTRLMKAYQRYIPTLNEKFKNLIAKKEAELDAKQKLIDRLTAQHASLLQETSLLEQTSSRRDQEVAEKQL